jgi:hypothetical protein
VFDKVFNYKPAERDYLVWTIVHPKIWLIPILAATLLIALAVHSTVLKEGSAYYFLVDDAAPVALDATSTLAIDPSTLPVPADVPVPVAGPNDPPIPDPGPR